MAAMGKISLLGTISLPASTTLSGHRGIFAPSVGQFDRLNFTKRWIPALHVFEDSLLGSGNDVFILNSKARADQPPYGMTYFPHKATGRFTDGRTAADFIDVKKEGKPTPKTGLNFASAASGTMPDTGNTKLYVMGARKFLVNNIGAIGCTPSFVTKAKPSTPCVDLFKEAVSKYNGILPAALEKLEAELPGLKFVIMNVFKLAIDIKNSPARFNIYDTTTSCYDSDVSRATTCKNMKSHLVFDNVPPTQTVRYLLKLYAIGARKLLVNNIGAIGCTWGFVKKAKPSTPRDRSSSS